MAKQSPVSVTDPPISSSRISEFGHRARRRRRRSAVSVTITKTIPLVGLLAVVASDIAVSPDGTRLFVTALAEDDNYAVAVVDTGTDAVTHVIPVGGRPRAVAPSPDGAHVYIGNFQSNGHVGSSVRRGATAGRRRHLHQSR